jgi:hypothetical protein
MFNLFYGEQVCSILFKTLAAPTVIKNEKKNNKFKIILKVQ